MRYQMWKSFINWKFNTNACCVTAKERSNLDIHFFCNNVEAPEGPWNKYPRLKKSIERYSDMKGVWWMLKAPAVESHHQWLSMTSLSTCLLTKCSMEDEANLSIFLKRKMKPQKEEESFPGSHCEMVIELESQSPAECSSLESFQFSFINKWYAKSNFPAAEPL